MSMREGERRWCRLLVEWWHDGVGQEVGIEDGERWRGVRFCLDIVIFFSFYLTQNKLTNQLKL